MVYSRLEKVPTSCLTTVETEADGSFESRNSQSQSWQYSKTLPPRATTTDTPLHGLFLSNYRN